MNLKEIKRFTEKFTISDSCWEWNAGKCQGYGSFRLGKRAYMAHIISYQLHIGNIPNGMCVCHSCDNRLCVNPFHLWLGSKSDNNKDRAIKGRSAIGELNGRAKISDLSIDIIKEAVRNGFRKIEIAKYFKISDRQIYHIINNQSRKEQIKKLKLEKGL